MRMRILYEHYCPLEDRDKSGVFVDPIYRNLNCYPDHLPNLGLEEFGLSGILMGILISILVQASALHINFVQGVGCTSDCSYCTC